MEIPPKRLDIYLILAVVLSLIPLTLAAVNNLVGLVAIPFIWLLVLIAALVIDDLSIRSRLKKAESEEDVVVTGDSDARVRELSGRVATLQRENSKPNEDAALLKVKNVELEKKLQVMRPVSKPSHLLGTTLKCGSDEYAYAMQRLQKNAVVDISCEPGYFTQSYSFYLLDEENFGRFKSNGRWDAESYQESVEGRHDTQVRVPHGGKWFFTIAPPFTFSVGDASIQKAEVKVTVFLLREGEADEPQASAETPEESISPATLDLLRAQLKQISRLRKFRAPLQGKESTQFVLWRTKTSELLWQALPSDSVHAEDFDDIDYEPKGFLGLPIPISDPGEAFAKGLDEAEAILKTVIEVLLVPPSDSKPEG